MRIYLDACCVCRLTDDRSQFRVRTEAHAMEQILGSVLNQAKRLDIQCCLIEELQRSVNPERKTTYGAFDAIHLASPEAGLADVLLTTDDQFAMRAFRGAGRPRVLVRNPILWLKEGQL